MSQTFRDMALGYYSWRLAREMLTEIGEQAITETLQPPQEGPPDMADMEKIMETARKYDTELLPPSGQ